MSRLVNQTAKKMSKELMLTIIKSRSLGGGHYYVIRSSEKTHLFSVDLPWGLRSAKWLRLFLSRRRVKRHIVKELTKALEAAKKWSEEGSELRRANYYNFNFKIQFNTEYKVDVYDAAVTLSEENRQMIAGFRKWQPVCHMPIDQADVDLFLAALKALPSVRWIL